MPKIFISYAWEDESHKRWVKSFADTLIEEAGLDVTLDQYDLSLGDRLPYFMEQSISNADYVLVICTPAYKQKSDKRSGGVGYEGHIISGELLTQGNERKFIPIIRRGTFDEAIPVCLSGKCAIDLTETPYYEENLKKLIVTLWGGKFKPNIGQKPNYVVEENPYKNLPNEPIRILGIITDEVTEPRMDNTRGSALYAIPFRLSRIPSSLWIELFLQAWRFPPRFSTMHRPNVASAYGDKIILNGTTIEEVKQYHKETLILCVEQANQQEQRILEAEQAERKAAEDRKAKHFSNVENIANEIKF